MAPEADAGNRRAERLRMVELQLRRRGLCDERVLSALEAVPRHRFVPPAMAASAYEDRALPIGGGQTISQPYMVARTCELAGIRPGDRVLEVGGGSGYQAAVLGRLAREVISIELRRELAEGARSVLSQLGADNVHIVCADGTAGYAAAAPFDAIVVAAAAPAPPAALKEQLAEGGRLVIPLGSSMMQVLTVFERHGAALRRQQHDGCVFVPLRGAGGWTGSAD